MQINELRHIYLEQRDFFIKQEHGVTREINKKIENELKSPLQKICVITGHRRVGKSTVLRQIAQNHRFRYLDFSDERLVYLKPDQYDLILEVFSMDGSDFELILFDEVQNKPNWNMFLNRLIKMGYKVIITGSNSTLLSKEITTYLTGRHTDFTLYPFSFKEYLTYKKIDFKKAYRFDIKGKIKKEFSNFLINGGFPELVKSNTTAYISTYFEDIVYKDIAARWHVKNIPLLKEVLIYLIRNAGRTYTYNSIMNAIQQKIDIHTVKKYVFYGEQSFLLFSLEPFSHSPKKSLRSPKKIYIIDNAYIKYFVQPDKLNKGHLLENLVLIELLRRYGDDLNFYKAGRECDFIVKEHGSQRVTKAVQVTYELSRQNKDREIKGLLEAMDYFNLDEGLILTYDQEDEVEMQGKRITVKPVWKWSLFSRE